MEIKFRRSALNFNINLFEDLGLLLNKPLDAKENQKEAKEKESKRKEKKKN
jgi:hypothetical protein